MLQLKCHFPISSVLRARWLPAALLLGIIVLVYAPSLYHVARGDQINYFAEMASRRGFFDTVVGTLDLNRTRDFASGDELAFRPLLYLILGLQKYFFGYAMFWWQACSLAAHLFAVGALYALLCRLRGVVFAFMGSAFFAFLPVNIEAVVWSHITPYVVFAGCVLMALRHLEASFSEDARTARHRGAALFWTVLMVFLYEAGIWYALVMGVFWWRQGDRRTACGAWGIAAVSLVVNMADLVWRGAVENVLAGFRSFEPGALIGLTFGKVALLAKWFLSAALFLDRADLVPVSRMMVREDVVAWAWPWGAPLTGAVARGSLLVLAIAGMAFFRPWRFLSRRGRSLLGLCLAMMGGYLFLIAIGRTNWLGAQGMCTTLYYPYNFLALGVVLMACVSRVDPVLCGANGRLIRAAGILLIGVAVVGNAWIVHRTVSDMAREHAATRQLVISLDAFVRQHEKEPGFSFYTGPGQAGNYPVGWLYRRGDAPGRAYILVEALYPQYFDKVHPKYVISNGP